MQPYDNCESILALTKVLKLSIELSGSASAKLFSSMVSGMLSASESGSARSAMYRLAISFADEHINALDQTDDVVLRMFPPAANDEAMCLAPQ
ncbi:hypothetical protein QLQ15_13145 [Lysobacter sp. LF1]|uniref:DUF3077 domain-containing protein n=1 Tax=Lysobacter stagni TaxID=3045172 RepID=A0ABT6XIH2_9GAMM|nr:hypothetical protein [Lysobacter sp. LF1]MDI9239851.1 hypothetical protein [Lysobacter sp. LF1]